MIRRSSRWSRAVTRAAAVALLAGGLIGGLHLDRVGAGEPAARFVALSDADEFQLLKARHNKDVAARAVRRAKESDAADAASADAIRVAQKAYRTEKRKIEAKKAAGTAFAGSIPSSCQEFKGNRAIGCAMMLSAGFGIDQFPCLEKLWDHESGWNHRAENRGSGAYGIPQSLPGSKMASAGADWRTNPATQIKWGLGYVKGRYGTPCGAWSNFQNNGSY